MLEMHPLNGSAYVNTFVSDIAEGDIVDPGVSAYDTKGKIARTH